MTPAKLEVLPVDAPDEADAPVEPVYRWANRTPEQKAIDRAEAMKYLRPGRPLPEGKTFDDVVRGRWPGDETDEEVNRALEELS